jgi:hypothetical protein
LLQLVQLNAEELVHEEQPEAQIGLTGDEPAMQEPDDK